MSKELNIKLFSNKENKEVFNENTDNIIILSDENFIHTYGLEDSLSAIENFIISLLCEFGIECYGASEKEFLLNPVNKIAIKRVFDDVIDIMYDNINTGIDSLFMNKALKENGCYIDLETMLDDLKEKISDLTENIPDIRMKKLKLNEDDLSEIKNLDLDNSNIPDSLKRIINLMINNTNDDNNEDKEDNEEEV